MMKVTPNVTVQRAHKVIEKFYNKGVLSLQSEYDRKTGKLMKDVFMNISGTKPIRISKYDKNENLVKDRFFADDGKYLGDVNYQELGNNFDFVL